MSKYGYNDQPQFLWILVISWIPEFPRFPKVSLLLSERDFPKKWRNEPEGREKQIVRTMAEVGTDSQSLARTQYTT